MTLKTSALGLILLGSMCYLYSLNKQFWIDDVVLKPVKLIVTSNVSSSAGVWQRVVQSSDIFVYSAYIDNRFPDRIRILGIVRSKETALLYCLLWYEKETASIPVRADIVYINEGHFKRLTAAYILCYIEKRRRPSKVSVVSDSTLERPQTILDVYIQTPPTSLYNITACISPLSAKESGFETRLIEWIETNLLLGIELFSVYILHINKDILRLLQHYEHVNRIEILNWTFPQDAIDAGILKDIHYHGQLAALNDCLYRNKGRSLYTMMTDIDELIIPQLQEDFTVIDILERFPSKSVYIFRHSYIKMSQNSVIHSRSMAKPSLNFLNSYMCDTNIKKSTDRSKMVVKPDNVVTVGIHNPWAILDPGEVFVVDPKMALLLHYRYTSDETIIWTESTSTLKYLNIVRHNMNKTLSFIQR